MILLANAKINLHLDVGPRRRDGYHSLRTLFQEISLHDTLHFSRSDSDITLTIDSGRNKLSAGPDNLVVRALSMLRDKLGVKKGMKVHLVKRIPMGAGLGGGSADAAAALWGGWLLWKAKSAKKPKRVPKVLFDCAKKLGADVSFFLLGGLAKAGGIGEKLTPLKPAKRRWLVLVYPRVHVSTPLAYRLLDESRISSPRNVSIQGPLSDRKMDPGLRHSRMTPFFNSFEPVILKKFPEIARAKRALSDLGCEPTLMSGSGSTVFGFVNNRTHGNLIRKRLAKKKWNVYLCGTVA